ncbi:MAG: efflux RND transporter periplasmic adaptor subunit [Candidatus Desantisbacteria bacterium]
MTHKKVFIIFVLIAVAFAAIFQIRSYLVALKQKPVVSLISPVRGGIINKITAEGNIEAQDMVRMDSPIAGKIQISQNLKLGSKVSKGEIMISLMPDEESVKATKEDLREAEESLRLTQKKFDLLKKACESKQEIKIDEMNLERAQRKYELSKKLYELGVISYQDLEMEEINFMREKSNTAKRREDALAELELEKLNVIKKENLINKLKEYLNPKDVTALFDGIITKINVKNGEIVSRGNELITLVNPKEIRAILRVSGENISKVKMGQKVMIKKEYYATNSIAGEIEEISMISEAGASEGKDYFKVRVKLFRSNEDNLVIGINKTVYGEIILEEKNKVITVPLDTIRYEEDGTKDTYLFLYKDGKAKKQRIQIGLKSEESVEIIKGITLHDKIINQGNVELNDNQKVKINTETR